MRRSISASSVFSKIPFFLVSSKYAFRHDMSFVKSVQGATPAYLSFSLSLTPI